MLIETARSLLAEPRVADPPRRVWRDWVLVAVMVPMAVIEVAMRDDLVWPATSLVLCLVAAGALLYRRTHPLAAVVAVFGFVTVAEIVSLVLGVTWEGLGTTAFVLLLPYSLFRWGSGRDAAIGLGVMLVPPLLGHLDDADPVGDVIGGVLILCFASALGAVARYERRVQERDREQVKLRERELLARELHDTVAHHVSAIAVQAQAGRTLAHSNPDAAVDALEVIEEEASRALSEMRTMVGALRRGDEPDLAPQPGVADIAQLTGNGTGPRVDVELAGDLDGLRPSVDTALYRLAQESVTNALRHAPHATRVLVRVVGDANSVRLTVDDDGHAGSPSSGALPGYGLVGMTERTALLGGTFEAGPAGRSGWSVTAVLPRDGNSR